MKGFILTLILVFCFSILSCAQGSLLIDDFEITISGGAAGTVDYGSGEGSSVEVAASREIKYAGSQSLKITYDAIPGGYMWVARGFQLDSKNADWLVKPEDINWTDFNAISFYMYGSDSKARIAFDIKDNGNEMWRIMIEDDFSGWKQIICRFDEFFARGDWQPHDADKNANLNFPIKSFQFEPRPEAKGTVYFDKVELIGCN
jgi:hypothetical protein